MHCLKEISSPLRLHDSFEPGEFFTAPYHYDNPSLRLSLSLPHMTGPPHASDDFGRFDLVVTARI
jgi:hypothetical protein